MNRQKTIQALLCDADFRSRLGLTQEEIAARSGVRREWLSKIKRGRAIRPDSNLIDKVYLFLTEVVKHNDQFTDSIQ